MLDSRDLDIDVDSNAEDSDDDNEDDDDEDDDPFYNVRAFAKDENVEHSNPHSFAWCLMRHACIVLAQQNLEKFLSMAGIEYSGKFFYINKNCMMSRSYFFIKLFSMERFCFKENVFKRK